MNNSVMKAALRKRKAKSFDSKGFLSEKEGENTDIPATAGMDSPDLKEKTSVALGDGVKQETLDQSNRHNFGSTDETSPSKEEMAAQSVEMEPKHGIKPFANTKKSRSGREVGGNNDEAVFEGREYDKVMNKKKPTNLYERMQMALGKKMGK